MTTLDELFEHMLQDIVHAEQQVQVALPRMVEAATSEELRAALEGRVADTANQIKRLEQVFQSLDKPIQACECEAIEGLIEEAEEVMDEVEDGAVRDAGLIAAVQAIGHYEMARYGTLAAWAMRLGMADAAKLLDQNLQEEKKADGHLTGLATRDINLEAV